MLSFLIEDLDLQVQPTSILVVRTLIDGSKKVLIQWKYLPHFEATWESYKVITQQFPHFHFENNVALQGGKGY